MKTCHHDFLCDWTTAPYLAGRERYRSQPQQHPGGPHTVQRVILEVKHFASLPVLMLRDSVFRKEKSVNPSCALRFCSIGGDGNLTTVTTLPSESVFIIFAKQHVCLFSAVGIALKASGHPCFFVTVDILRHFNPNLMGYSNGTGTQDTPQAFLNQAVAGAKTKWVIKFIQSCKIKWNRV